jgi:hypothetical protein
MEEVGNFFSKENVGNVSYVLKLKEFIEMVGTT